MPNYRLRKGSLQWGFNHSRAKMQIFGGAFANGKTTALVIKSLQLVKDYPGCNGLLARETYPKLNDTLRREFFKWCPVDWIRKMPTQDDNTCYMHNGAIVNFRYVAQQGKKTADGSSSSNLLSATYDWIGVDQIEDPGIGHKDLLDLMGRLRGQTHYRPTDGSDDTSMPSTGPRWIMLTANPSPNWFFKEIVQPYLIWKKSGTKTPKLLVDTETGVPIMDLYEGSTYTNAENLPADFIKGLESTYKGQMRERFLEGKWAAYEGLVHGEFTRETNIISRAEAMAHLENCQRRHVKVKVLEAYDFGLTSPSCYLLAFVDDWGRVVIFDGYHRGGFHYTEQPDEIRRIRQSYAGYGLEFNQDILADPAIFKTIAVAGRKDTGDTIAKLYKDDNIYMRPASNEILAGIAKVNGYINGRLDVSHIVTGDKPGTMLYVCDDLDFIEDEITSYYWKRNPGGQAIDEPNDQNDHAMNTIKYMLSKLPQPAKVVVPSQLLPPGWMFWQEEDVDAR